MASIRNALLIGAACLLTSAASAQQFVQTNLVSDGSVPAVITDPNLVNPWGVSYAPSGPFWVSDTGKSVSTLYDGTGAIQPLVVPVVLPTGQVFNGTTGFPVTSGGKTAPAVFLFATITGTIAGWNPSISSSAVPAVDNSAHAAVYLGLAKFTDASGTYLLAANFASGLVEVYDAAFKRIFLFRDQGGRGIGAIPASYSPHNVAVVGGHIFVAYAKVDAASGHEQVGYGLGFVDEVELSGRLIRRVATHGALNAPWGMAQAPASFGRFANALLVGNFGDGRISAYHFATGRFLGQLVTDRQAYFAEPGLWSLLPGNGGSAGDAATLYFSAGIDHEAHGLFGSLAPTH